MLTADELDDARQAAEEALPDLADIYRFTVTSDGGGGTTETWTIEYQDVPCRLSPVSGGEITSPGSKSEVGEQPVDVATSIVTFPHDQDITTRDVVVIDGEAFDVTLVRQRGGWEITRRVEVKEAADGVPS